MKRCNEKEPARDGLTGEAMIGEDMDIATASEALSRQRERSGDPTSIASSEARIEEQKFQIGAQNEWEATLPLSAKEAFFATSQQRVRIGRAALDTILKENPESRGWDFSRLRDEIMKRTGLQDAAASLVVFARKNELEET